MVNSGYFLDTAAPHLHEAVKSLSEARLVLFVGLPGSGKSLFKHQLTHLAHAQGRTIHQMPGAGMSHTPFRESHWVSRYPIRGPGQLHPVLFTAAGLWFRSRMAAWFREHPGPEHLLIGEAPLMGNRLLAPALPGDDEVEPFLASSSSRFVLLVPTVEVQQHIDTIREVRSVTPTHERERYDAPPAVMRVVWNEVVEEGRRLGLTAENGSSVEKYDPTLYRSVYERLLKHRHFDVVSLDVVLPTGEMSVYAHEVPYEHIESASGEDVDRFMQEAQLLHPGHEDAARA